jgi:hypothetical protein
MMATGEGRAVHPPFFRYFLTSPASPWGQNEPGRPNGPRGGFTPVSGPLGRSPALQPWSTCGFPAHANTGDPNGPLEALPPERMRADIHGSPEQTLQSEPDTLMQDRKADRSTKTSCGARPDHTFGSVAADQRCPRRVRLTSDRSRIGAPQQRRTGPARRSKRHLHDFVDHERQFGREQQHVVARLSFGDPSCRLSAVSCWRHPAW